MTILLSQYLTVWGRPIITKINANTAIGKDKLCTTRERRRRSEDILLGTQRGLVKEIALDISWVKSRNSIEEKTENVPGRRKGMSKDRRPHKITLGKELMGMIWCSFPLSLHSESIRAETRYQPPDLRGVLGKIQWKSCPLRQGE